MQNNQSIENIDYLPFKIQWIDSSYQQTFLPDSPWHRILNALEPTLADRIRQQFNDPQRRQIILELIGHQFQQKFFLFEPDIPYILNPPFISKESRHQLENEAKSWLQIQTYKAALETGAAVPDNARSNQLSNDMKNFLEYTYEIIKKSFDRYLYQIQQKDTKNYEEKQLFEIYKRKQRYELTDGARYTNSQKLPTINEMTSITYSMTSQYSDRISNSIVALLKRDIRLLIFIKEKLFGQQLPKNLRQFVWTECLLLFERKPFHHNLSVVELQTRRDFAAGVARGKHDLNVKNPSDTPITNLIEHAVIETYSTTPGLYSYLEEYHLRFTIKILNVLYTYKKYEPYYIYLLFPFQLTYNDETDRDEEIYANAMNLDLFIRHCFPKWSHIPTIADRIMFDVSMHDEEFYEHLNRISKIHININSKDFCKEITSIENNQDDPSIFLRKWISQMFVGILNTNSVLYLWDQFFMIKWNIDYIEYATKAVFYLLRHRFMYANDYVEMRKVFIEEPYHLYTIDIQTAFVHLALKHEDSRYIPAINRRFYPFKSISLNKQRISSEIIGIKNISLSLIMPVRKDPRHEFKYKSLIVEVRVYEEREQLDTMSTKSIPVMRSKEVSINDWQKIILDIPNETLILSIKRVHKSFTPTYIQALVIVHQRIDILTLKPFAYCRFPLYIPQKIGPLDTWDVTYGQIKRVLHPGIPPISIDMISDQPRAYLADKIGPNSTISLVVFDPKIEQHLI